jgi:hypothetical protein
LTKRKKKQRIIKYRQINIPPAWPKECLPSSWSIEHNIPRLAIRSRPPMMQPMQSGRLTIRNKHVFIRAMIHIFQTSETAICILTKVAMWQKLKMWGLELLDRQILCWKQLSFDVSSHPSCLIYYKKI